MKQLHYILITLFLALSGCVKHTDIVYMKLLILETAIG